MRGRRVRTVVALAPILIAVLVAASMTACERDPAPRPPDPTTPLAAGAGAPPAAFATANPTRGVPTTTIRPARTATTGQPKAQQLEQLGFLHIAIQEPLNLGFASAVKLHP
jgi:hypothetical protein